MGQSQKVLVAGTGISGIAAARLLLDMGGEVVLYDGNTELDPDTLKGNFEEGASVSVLLGDLKRTDLLGVEMCVISPGISLETPFVNVLDEAGIPIWSEIQPVSYTHLDVYKRQVCVCGKESRGRVITRKPIVPSGEEMEENKRSKSSKLRVFERI